MGYMPETRPSLIARLPDSDDTEAWNEFVEIYEPVVFQLARRGGLQHADAKELAQEVLLSVSQAVSRFDPDRSNGRFRSWLIRIARNNLINSLARRRRHIQGSGDSRVARMLEQLPDAIHESAADIEFRRQLFQWAAQRIRRRVQDHTWQAFWLTSVENLPIEEVARKLAMTPGAVYIARSRVMARLRREVEQREEVEP